MIEKLVGKIPSPQEAANYRKQTDGSLIHGQMGLMRDSTALAELAA